MTKNKIIDIDAEFDGVEFDEAAIARYTGQKNSPEKMKQARNSVIWRESINNYWQRRKDNPEPYIESQKLAGELRKTNAIWQQSMKEGKKSLFKPIKTPFGIFESVKSAIDKKVCCRDTLYRKLKSKEPGYEYITKDEYRNLTENTKQD